MPKIAAEIAAPLANADKISLVAGADGTIGATRIPLPHIKLTHRNESIGFGLSKADALMTLWPQIEQWAKRS